MDWEGALPRENSAFSFEGPSRWIGRAHGQGRIPHFHLKDRLGGLGGRTARGEFRIFHSEGPSELEDLKRAQLNLGRLGGSKRENILFNRAT